MVQAIHSEPVAEVLKVGGWRFTWSFRDGAPDVAASLPADAVARLTLRHRRDQGRVIVLDDLVVIDGAEITVEVPRSVTASQAWAAGTYDGLLRIIDPADPVDLYEVAFVLPVSDRAPQ